ncbi:SETMR methyltransferase, partial [Acromyrmex insinuator]
MLTVGYGETTLDRSNVYRWYKMFSEGREDMNDEECEGRPSTSTTDESIDEVKKIVLANRRITVREVAEDLNIFARSNPPETPGFNCTLEQLDSKEESFQRAPVATGLALSAEGDSCYENLRQNIPETGRDAITSNRTSVASKLSALSEGGVSTQSADSECESIGNATKSVQRANGAEESPCDHSKE